jgi:hypothetical protein
MNKNRKKSGQIKGTSGEKQSQLKTTTGNMAAGVSATGTCSTALSQANEVLYGNPSPSVGNPGNLNPTPAPQPYYPNYNLNPAQPALPPYQSCNNNNVSNGGHALQANATGHAIHNNNLQQQSVYQNPPQYPGHSTGPNIAAMLQHMNSQFSARFSNIEDSLSKLTTMESDLTHLRVDVTSLKSENKQITGQLNEFEKFCQVTSDVSDDYMEHKKSNEAAMQNVFSEVNNLKSENTVLKQENSDLNGKLLEIQSRMMEKNLLLFGIDEVPLSSNRDNTQEDTEHILREFISETLHLEKGVTADKIEFDRVHRLGRRRFDRSGKQIRPRPIVAKFEK